MSVALSAIALAKSLPAVNNHTKSNVAINASILHSDDSMLIFSGDTMKLHSFSMKLRLPPLMTLRLSGDGI